MPATVSLVKGKKGKDINEVRQMMAELLALLGSPAQIIPRGSKVLIKPNLTAEENLWERGGHTSPLFMQALIEEIQKANPAEIIIAEGTAIGLDTKKAFAANGYEDVARRTGARLIDLYDGEYDEVPTPPGSMLKTISITKAVREADFFINAPAMKTHVATTITVAMKNLKGTTTYAEKKRFHYYGLNKAIAELNAILKPHLNVVDGLIAMEGDGPLAGIPVGLNLLMAGNDAVAVDTIAARIMGIDPEEVPALSFAQNMGYGIRDEKEIKILGASIAEVSRPFRRASAPLEIKYPNISWQDGQACDFCRNVLRLAWQRLTAMKIPVEKFPPLEIIIGPEGKINDRSPNLKLPLGRCQKGNKNFPHYVPGCPPQVFLLVDELQEILNLPRRFGPKKDFILD